MRKNLAALLLALGLASLSTPVLAAVCGPVPALPDTTRRTEYAGIVAQTGPFNVSFQLYGDGTDYGNWLSVWVNGVAKTPVTDFVVTSPSGALGSLCLPISDAQVTFTAAQTGTIEIEGGRRARRLSQVSENAGVKAHDFNVIISDLTAQLRERWDREGRLLRTPPGETLAVMQPAATRANGFLCWDATGLIPGTCGPALGALLAANNLSDLTNVATARTNLGLGTMATQNANAVAITGGTIAGTAISGGSLGGTVSGTPTLSGANFVANSNLAQAGGATLKMNATAGTANSTDTKISALTDITSPSTTLDWIPIEDHIAGTIKKTNAAELVAAIGGGVTAVTAGTGLAASPNPIVGTGTITAPIVMPQGRLTLQSGAPVMTTSHAAKGTVFYDCDQGGTVPRFTGSVDTFDAISSCEVSANMVSAASAGQIVSGQVYDWWWVNGNICAAMSASTGGGGGWAFDTTSDAAHTGNTHTSTLIDNLSTNVIKFGWTPGMTIAGSGIPGATTIVSIGSDGLSVVISAATTTTLTGTTLTVTGGTNALRGFSYTQIDKSTRPYATNRNSITNCFTGATNRGPVAANQGTFLGTFFATANGQTSFVYGSNATGGGQAASLYLWNAYNRRDVKTSVSDSVSNWTIADGLVHSFNNDAGTRLNFVVGLAEDVVGVNLFDQVCGVTNPNYPIMAIGFALDRSGNTTFDKVNITYVNSAAILAGNPRACGPLSVNSTYVGLQGAHFIQALANQDGQATAWTGEYYGGTRTSFDGYFRM